MHWVVVWESDNSPGGIDLDIAASVSVNLGEEPENTPTPTSTPKPTELTTPTPTSTPVPGDTNGDDLLDSSDLFYFSLYWQDVPNETSFDCNPIRDNSINEKDLLLLIGEWE